MAKIEESISMQQEAENLYINIKEAYESGMTYWKEALLVVIQKDIHPIVKEHVKFLILQNKKSK